MNATYERIFNAINKKPRVQRELARKVIVWITHARRPLPIDALITAVSIIRDVESLKDLASSTPTEKDIVNACANLISVDRTHPQYVRFIHLSVQEFVTGCQSTCIKALGIGHEEAHKEIAQTCMIFQTRFPKQRDSLGLYTLNEWPHHLFMMNLNALGVEDQMVTLASSFFDTSPLVLIEQPPKFEWWDSSTKVYHKFSLPVLALIFDLPECGSLHGKQLENEQSTFQSSDLGIILSDDKLSIHYAVAQLDSVPIAQRLYDYGCTVNYSYCTPGGKDADVPPWLKTPSLYLVRSTRMARFLLNSGASIEPQYLHGTLFDPLQYFSEGRNLDLEVFQLVLDRLRDVDRNGERFGHAMQAAALRGDVKVTRLLLDKGADIIIQGGKYGNVFPTIAGMGNVGFIQLLLDKGADINIQGGKYGNALQAAVWKSNVEVIQLLLDKGADINIQGGKYGNALQAAVRKSNVEAIQLLLDKGADVNLQGGMLRKALQAALLLVAALYDNVEVIRRLLDTGADANVRSKKYGSALQAAVRKSNVEVIQLLLDKGADVNLQGGEYGSALQAAVLRGNVEITQLLLDNGAGINIQGGEYGSALQAALWKGDIGVIRLLLGKGADVHIQGGLYGNTLQAASYKGNVETIQLLLDKGVHVNTEGGKYGSALQAAVWMGNVEVIRLLLDKGADVHARGGKYGTALQAALAPVPIGLAHTGPAYIFPVVELLLDYGADARTYVPGSKYGSALNAARQVWKEDRDSLDTFIKLLVSRGWKEDEEENDEAQTDGTENGEAKNGDAQSSGAESNDVLTSSQGSIEGASGDSIEGHESPNMNRSGYMYMWGLTFLALLLYAFLRFWA